MLSYNMVVIYYILERIGNVLGDFGANRVHIVSKIGTPKVAYKYDHIIRVFCI